MFRITARFSRRVIVGALAVLLTAAAAVAGTIHTFAVSQTTGSEGAYDFLQTAVGGALQGEVGSGASTGLGTPFGIFGKYGPPSATTTKGIGVVGISSVGWGVVGDNIGGGPALYAFPNENDGIGLDAESDNQEAIYGEAHSKDGADGADIYSDGNGDGIYGNSNGGIGVQGYSASGNGVYGESSSGYGVEALSVNNDGVYADIVNGYSGVAGINDANGNGLYGQSATGFGVRAVSETTASPAPSGAMFQYAATYSQSVSGAGVYGINTRNVAAVNFGTSYNRYTGMSGYSTDGAGVYGYSQNDTGVIAESGGVNPPLVVESDSSTTSAGYEILAGSANGASSNSGFNFAVETNGNEFVGGSVTSAYGTFAVTRNPRSDVATYGAESTEPMVEDVGSAQLVNGSATVPLAGDFRQTIQDATRYLVFITPEGDSKGLYVTQKSPAGFIVREAQGGHSTMEFDYRIVAQRYGVQTGRLPHIAALSPRMAQLRSEALHPNPTAAYASSALKYAIVAPPIKERSKRAPLSAQALIASVASHRRMTRPPAPAPGFLAGARIHN